MRRKVLIMAALGLLGGAGAGVSVKISAADRPEGTERPRTSNPFEKEAEQGSFPRRKTSLNQGIAAEVPDDEKRAGALWEDSPAPRTSDTLNDDTHSEGGSRRFKLRPAAQPINYSQLFSDGAKASPSESSPKSSAVEETAEPAGTATLSGRTAPPLGSTVDSDSSDSKVTLLGTEKAPQNTPTQAKPSANAATEPKLQLFFDQPVSTLGPATNPKKVETPSKQPLTDPATKSIQNITEKPVPTAPSLTILQPVPFNVNTNETRFPQKDSSNDLGKKAAGEVAVDSKPVTLPATLNSDAAKDASPILPTNTASVPAKPEGESKATAEIGDKKSQEKVLIHAAHEGDTTSGSRVEQVSGAIPFPRSRGGVLPVSDDPSQPPRIQALPPSNLTPPRAGHHLPTAKARESGSPFPEAESKYLKASHNDSAPVAAPALATPSRLARPSQLPTVTTEWVRKSELKVGKACLVDLVVRNTGRMAAKDVVIEAFFPPSVRLTQTQPAPIEKAEQLSWNFPQLKPGEEQTISIQLVPSKSGPIEAHAFVRLTGATAGTFTVEEPLVKVAIQGPESVQVGDPASQILLVSNPGTGVATNVRIEARIPAGLEHARGERVSLEIGSLNAGESRTVRLALSAVTGGTHRLDVAAVADSVPAHIAHANIQVVAPSLKLAIEGPGLRYVGRNAVFTVHATNDGGAASNNVRIVHNIPPGYKFLRANKGGKLEQDGSVAWYVGRIEPGQSYRVDVELAATAVGSGKHLVTALAEGGVRTRSEFESQVEGSASLVLEIVDLDDPVEVGRETAYEVRVRNEGTKEARNVGLSCELPNGVELIGAKGPSNALTESGLIVFKSIDTLPAGKTAIFRVHVKGRVDGNHRFRARLASDSIQEPLIFEELTRFYKE